MNLYIIVTLSFDLIIEHKEPCTMQEIENKSDRRIIGECNGVDGESYPCNRIERFSVLVWEMKQVFDQKRLFNECLPQIKLL